MTTHTLIYKQEELKPYHIRINFTSQGVPSCCGAILFHGFTIILIHKDDDSSIYNRVKNINQETYNKIDKDEFFKYVEAGFKAYANGLRVFATAIDYDTPRYSQERIRDEYYMNSNGHRPLSLHKLLQGLNFIKQESWVNKNSNNTLDSFYKDYTPLKRKKK